MKKQIPNTEHSTTPWRGFFSVVLKLVTKILTDSSVSFKYHLVDQVLNSVSSSFPIQHFTPWRDWTFPAGSGVRCSFFSVPLGQNKLALMRFYRALADTARRSE
ncbi:MAG: hypothetical protein GY849_17780 [Deltaproteobacteria bacterium]|nr:hypothetical protein [Deltaproteobacteria bacterium]